MGTFGGKALRRLVLSVAMALIALMLPAAGSQAAGPDHPLPPSGYQIDVSPPPGTTIEEEIVTLPASACAVMNQALVERGQQAEKDCRAIHGSYGFNHRPLPAGTVARSTGGLFDAGTVQAAAAYWHWGWYDYECSLYGCMVWKVSLEEEGVANGSNVWQWGVYCTPSGLGTVCTWKGYFHNGGGWPYYAMQFGENSCTGASVNGTSVCMNHGIRRWIDDWGNGGAVSYF